MRRSERDYALFSFRALGSRSLPLVEILPVADFDLPLIKFLRWIANGLVERSLLVGIDPPEADDVRVISNTAEAAIRVAEFIPVRKALVRCIPTEGVLILAGHDTVNLSNSRDTFLLKIGRASCRERV